MPSIYLLKEEIKSKILRRIEERTSDRVKSYDEMTYDELFNEIVYNKDDSDTLTLIAEGIRHNPNLSDLDKDELWREIEKWMNRGG